MKLPGSLDPSALVKTRLLLHYAAQIPGAVGNSWATPTHDDTHTTLEVLPGTGLALTRTVDKGCRIGISFPRAAWVATDADGVDLAVLPITGTTLDEARLWCAQQWEKRTGIRPEALEARDYGLPEHEVTTGAAFPDVELEASAELGLWYEFGLLAVNQTAPKHEGASITRVWPHHFDVAALIALDADAETGRSVNIGFSPDDPYSDVPYFYVVPYPAKADDEVAELFRGFWFRDGWLGAMMKSTDVAALPEGERNDAVVSFINEATAACMALLTPNGGKTE